MGEASRAFWAASGSLKMARALLAAGLWYSYYEEGDGLVNCLQCNGHKREPLRCGCCWGTYTERLVGTDFAKLLQDAVDFAAFGEIGGARLDAHVYGTGGEELGGSSTGGGHARRKER